MTNAGIFGQGGAPSLARLRQSLAQGQTGLCAHGVAEPGRPGSGAVGLRDMSGPSSASWTMRRAGGQAPDGGRLPGEYSYFTWPSSPSTWR
ncbi:MAG: hypothetical protein V8S34_07065 [Lawsonibacter sp.]